MRRCDDATLVWLLWGEKYGHKTAQEVGQGTSASSCFYHFFTSYSFSMGTISYSLPEDVVYFQLLTWQLPSLTHRALKTASFALPARRGTLRSTLAMPSYVFPWHYRRFIILEHAHYRFLQVLSYSSMNGSSLGYSRSWTRKAQGQTIHLHRSFKDSDLLPDIPVSAEIMRKEGVIHLPV